MHDPDIGWADSCGLPPVEVPELCVRDIVDATGGRLLFGDETLPLQRLVTDSRRIESGDVFWALESERDNGSRFAAGAVRSGAQGVVVSQSTESWSARPAFAVRVDSGRRALGQLARFVRARQAAKIIGITGTCGKTSTKALAAAALEGERRTVAAWKSFNNDLGVPWTLLRLRHHTEACVLEIGTNAPGEIAHLAGIARPDIAVVLNIGPGHLHGLRDLAGVCREKGDLVATLGREGVAILNADDPCFEELAARAPGRVVPFGEGPAAELRAESIALSVDRVRFRCRGVSVEVPFGGRHQVANALAALAIAEAVGVPIERAAEGLAHCRPIEGRLVPRRLGGLWVLDDVYNANPLSMAAALETLKRFPAASRKVAILGDMLELGDDAERYHEELGERAMRAADGVIAVGTHREAIASGVARAGGLAESFESVEALCSNLPTILEGSDVVLVKASRAAGFERVVAAIRRQLEPGAKGVVTEGGHHVV
ncbi:MAG: UDP-N-acetylmuramoyl-tripeptide--D-alanyl-D-alanine ligase [Planctomycetota bacterium]